LVRIGPTAWPFTGFIHTDIHTDRQLDKYILDILESKKPQKLAQPTLSFEGENFNYFDTRCQYRERPSG
jgi:hypothetical protein